MTERQPPSVKRPAAGPAAGRARTGTDTGATAVEPAAVPPTPESRRTGFHRIGLASLPLPPGMPPMEARLVEALPGEPGWQFEPKWDGFRCLAYRAGPQVELQSKSGRSLARYFPEVVPAGGILSFEALRDRLHPAESRVRRLAAQTPALLMLFDCLAMNGGGALLDTPLSRRRAVPGHFSHSVGDQPALRLTPFTLDAAVARRWLDMAGGGLDGVVAKRVDGRYLPGAREMLKVKRVRSADCVVGGFRCRSAARTPAENPPRAVEALLLGLYDKAGKLHLVGFTDSIADAERDALTRHLEALAAPGRGDGRTEAWQPLAPAWWSRWNTTR